MKHSIIIILIALFTCSLSVNSYAQEKEKESPAEINIGVDLMSRFVWRGMNLGGSSPSIQPYVGLVINNFEIGAWGAYSGGGINKNQEFDLYASYTFANDMFTLTVTDYYSTSEISDYNYFDYSEENTGHFYEGTLSFNGTENIPVSFLASMIFFGADALKINDDATSIDFNLQAGIQYSNYFELAYNTEIKNVSLNAFLGFTLSNPKKSDLTTGYIGETGFYGNSPGVINIGITTSKEIQITEKFALPITASLITNPQAEKVFFTVGFSF